MSTLGFARLRLAARSSRRQAASMGGALALDPGTARALSAPFAASRAGAAGLAAYRCRRGFSLLEVMIALAILVVCVVILVDSQASSALMTAEAQKLIVATNLAQEKTAEAMLRTEKEGFTDTDKCDSGDFASFGDDELNLEFGDSLDAYHWEYCISEINVALAGDIVGMAQGLAGSGAIAGSPLPSDAGGAGGLPGGLDLAMFGLSPEVMSEMLSRYIREVRVRVWYGESSKSSKESGDEVIVVTHAINPTGAVRQMATEGPQ